jgi:hypothetical protein
MNIYNGYFSNPDHLLSNFNYFGEEYIENHYVKIFSSDIRKYDATVLNLSGEEQYFTLNLTDGTNVQDISYTEGDLIQIPNFYNSNTAIGNYKTATL